MLVASPPAARLPIVATPARVLDLPDPSTIVCLRRPNAPPIDGLHIYQDGYSVIVARITPGLLADALREAGLKVGDRIYKIDGCSVGNTRDVANHLQAVAPGFGALIKVYRSTWLNLTFKAPEPPKRKFNTATATPRSRPTSIPLVARKKP